jgi:TonB family protein
MVQYILEILAFQLLFLVVYDLFLKRETFFQWNRFYLMGTFILATILPWIKIEAFKTSVPSEIMGYPGFIWQLDSVAVGAVETETNWLASLPTEYLIFGIGAILSALWFGYKLFQIYWLKEKGTIRHYKDFTKVVVKKSELAFSFFKNIFLGEQIKKENEANIVAHELVHIKQWHSLDLLFFEIMRIAFWFNPLVYVYQKRVSELHEFIADSIVAKTNKKEQYQVLLAEAFQTQNISFVNQFFKKSLIKKRIVMLSKTKSKKVYQFKYLLLVPLVLGMLVYTSCEQELKEAENFENSESSSDDAALIASIENDLKNKSFEELMRFAFRIDLKYNLDESLLSKEDFFRKEIALKLWMPMMHERRPFKHADDSFVEIPYPSSKSYKNYVNREVAFKTLDKNLKASILQKEYSVRLIEKTDKNLGSGEFFKVENIKDLTGEEIRKVNQTLEHIKGTERFLFLSDDEYSFLISNSKNPTQTITTKQETEVLDTAISVPFAVIEEVPIFPGCENVADKKACFTEKIQNHIRKNFNYPKEAQELGVQGRVSLVFTISTDGSIKNIRKRGPHELLEDEAVRIIERLPKMQPGKQKGEAVDVPFSIPITFKLQDDKSNELNGVKLDIASSMLELIKSSKEFDLLPMNIGLHNNEIRRTTERFNQLVVERRRLLETTSEENPIIVKLNDQLTVLKLKIREELNNEVDKINN